MSPPLHSLQVSKSVPGADSGYTARRYLHECLEAGPTRLHILAMTGKNRNGGGSEGCMCGEHICLAISLHVFASRHSTGDASDLILREWHSKKKSNSSVLRVHREKLQYICAHCIYIHTLALSSHHGGSADHSHRCFRNPGLH